MTAVPILIRRVRPAIAAAMVSGCGRYPSSKKWCSVTHTESMPRRSASAIRSIVRLYRSAHGRRHPGGLRMSE